MWAVSHRYGLFILGEVKNMKYYRAELHHCEELTSLRLAMRKERDVTFDEVSLRTHTLSFFERNIEKGTHIAFVCEDNGCLVATVGLSLFEMPPTDKLINGKVIKLMNMYTVPKYRRKGIAKKLLEMAISFAKENEYYKIMLNSSPMGKALYEQVGFSLINNEYELSIK